MPKHRSDLPGALHTTKKRFAAFIAATCLLVSACASVEAPDSPIDRLGQNTESQEGNRHEIIQLRASDNKIVSAILMSPKSGIDPYAPAIVLHHGGFGGHPARQVGASRFAAERFSRAGYTTVSLLSRQSGGHIDSLFEESQLDIDAAIDFLEARGISKIILAGHSLGSVRINGYMVDRSDPRVKAMIHFAPTADMPDFRRDFIGEEHYRASVEKAEDAISAGQARIDLSPDPLREKGLTSDVFIDLGATVQSPAAYLSWWGPDARTRNTDLFPLIETPILLLSGTEDGFVPQGRLEALRDAARRSSRVDLKWYQGGDHFFTGFQDEVSSDVMAWLAELGLGIGSGVETRLIDTPLTGGRAFPGVLYSPNVEQHNDGPTIILQHDYPGTIMEPAEHWLAIELAQAGFTVVNPMLRASGIPQSMREPPSIGEADLETWLDHLQAEGHQDFVVVSRSAAQIWTLPLTQKHSSNEIKGVVFLNMPEALPSLAKRRLGDKAYQALVEKSQELIDSGEPAEMILDKYYEPAPKVAGERSMFLQRAEIWHELFGPSEESIDETLSSLNVPLLILADEAELTEETQRNQSAVLSKLAGLQLAAYDGTNDLRSDASLMAEKIARWIKRDIAK